MHRLGPYRLFRQIEPLGHWERWIALHEFQDTDHVVYRHGSKMDAYERRRSLERVALVSAPAHPHLLPIEAFSFDESGHLCLVAPYTGNQEGLVPIEHLLARRSGRLDVPEVARCVEHLLEAVDHARAKCVWVDRIDPARILIDRRGSVLYELYGLVNPRLLDRTPRPVSDDVREIAEVAAWLLTGIEPSVAPVSVARIAGRNAKAWESWINTATDPLGGYETIAEAIQAMPTRGGLPAQSVTPPAPAVRTSTPLRAVIRRFRRDADLRDASRRNADSQ